MAAEDIIPHQFKPGQSGNPKGRPPGFKTEVRRIYNEDNSIIWVDAEHVKERTHKGKKQYGLQLTKKNAILAKLDRLIMKAKDSVAMAGIKFLFKDILMDKEIKNQTNIQNNVEVNEVLTVDTEEVVNIIKFF